jgi:hypothetical protein
MHKTDRGILLQGFILMYDMPSNILWEEHNCPLKHVYHEYCVHERQNIHLLITITLLVLPYYPWPTEASGERICLHHLNMSLPFLTILPNLLITLCRI